MDFLETQKIEGTRRILSVWLPRLPTDRLRRRPQAQHSDRALVIAKKIDNALRIHALDQKASRCSLRLGMPLANAIAMAPQIQVVEADERADATLLDNIADWCDRFTPYVALDLPHALLLDITGLPHLFGGERPMVDAVQAALRGQKFTVCTGVAGTSVAARALSHYAPNTIVEPGYEADALAPLPVAALDCDARTEHALRRAGLKTIGDVAKRQRVELTARFGKEFTFLLERALGRGDWPISPKRPVPDFMAERRFAEPIVAEAVMMETLRSLAGSLGALLDERGKGARLLVASFYRADGAVRRIGIETGNPTRDPALIARLFQLKIDELSDPIDPGFGFDLIRLEACRTQTDAPQSVTLNARDNDARDMDRLVDMLSARFGTQCVQRFHRQETHIPEAEGVALPAQHGRPQTHWKIRRSADEMPRRPLRLLHQPEPIAVMAQIPDGPPLHFRWRGVRHSAVFAAGPETISMEWWRHQDTKPARDYFRVEDETGRRYWLYRDGMSAGDGMPALWYMHGLFA
jgi:protein ImuB